jgi:hypothetical protein
MTSNTPVVVSPTRVRNAASHGGKGILQSNPKYQPTVLVNSEADKRDGLPQERSLTTATTTAGTETSNDSNSVDAIPDVFIDTIIEGFGVDADIFKDILHVTPDADPRQLRICYFRRGREVLSEGGVHGLGGLVSGEHVSDLTKIRFQAVTMAYEILSNPVWRAIYVEQGLKPAPSEKDQSSAFSQSKLSRVKWNEDVEELIFDLEPDEKTEPFERKKKNRGKKVKTQIFIEEDEELDEHLAKLDAEAEPHFVSDFLDNLEESLDGLLKFASTSSRDEPPSKPSRNKNDNNEASSLPSGDREAGPIERVTSNDEDSLAGMFATHILGIGNPNPVSPESTTLVPLSHSEAKSPVPFRCVSPDPCRDDDIFDLDDIALSPTSSVSSGKQDTKKNIDTEEEDDGADDDEDVFDGLEEGKPSSIVLRRYRDASPANFSMTSELSESVANQSRSPSPFEPFQLKPEESKSDEQFHASNDNSPNTPLSVEELFKEMADEEFFEDTWWPQLAKSLRFGDYNTDEGEKKTETEEGDPAEIPMKSKLSSRNDENFLQVFKTFMMAIAVDCEKMRNNMSEFDCMGAFMLEDEELLELMDIVAKEVKKVPALHAEDAVESPAQHFLETARSFS